MKLSTKLNDVRLSIQSYRAINELPTIETKYIRKVFAIVRQRYMILESEISGKQMKIFF